MACAAIVRFCLLRNSYITVVTSPGCTCTDVFSGLKSQGPRELASNSTVIVRLRSTWVFTGAFAPVQLPEAVRWSDSVSTLMPRASQMLRYIGTSA